MDERTEPRILAAFYSLYVQILDRLSRSRKNEKNGYGQKEIERARNKYRKKSKIKKMK